MAQDGVMLTVTLPHSGVVSVHLGREEERKREGGVRRCRGEGEHPNDCQPSLSQSAFHR